MTPRILRAVTDGYVKRLEQQDYINWSNGYYTMSAVAVAIERNLAGKKSKAEYIKEPLLTQMQKEKKLDESELQKQRELFMEKLKIMQANYELSHPKKEKTVDGMK